MLYVYFKKDDKKAVKDNNPHKSSQKTATQKPIKAQLVISNDRVPIILGRNGTHINMIEEKTCTKIRFRDKNEHQKYCEITGTANNVTLAQELVQKEIDRLPIVTEEMFLPQSVCGRITGRCGEAMQEICRSTMAKVSLDAGISSSASDRRRIIIKGNRMQVNMAIKLLEEKIEEDAKLQQEIEELEQTRGPRRSPTHSVHSSQSSLSTQLPPREKLAMSNHKGTGIEVYVSAIASPSKFWVQIIGFQSKKLDDLVAEMTTYYENEENRKEHIITEPYLGQIVAAEFKFDGKWYRAEIVGILPNQYNPNEVVLDLYFVDYGDSEYVAPHEIFEIRTDFLMLR